MPASNNTSAAQTSNIGLAVPPSGTEQNFIVAPFEGCVDLPAGRSSVVPLEEATTQIDHRSSDESGSRITVPSRKHTPGWPGAVYPASAARAGSLGHSGAAQPSAPRTLPCDSYPARFSNETAWKNSSQPFQAHTPVHLSLPPAAVLSSVDQERGGEGHLCPVLAPVGPFVPHRWPT